MIAAVFGSLLTLSMPLFASTTVIQSTVCDQLSTPTITAPSATQVSSPFIVSGVATANTTVTVLSDGEKLTSTVADSAGLFATSVSVASGSHALTVSSSNVCGQTATSATKTITIAPTSSGGSATPTPTDSSSGTSTPKQTLKKILATLRAQLRRYTENAKEVTTTVGTGDGETTVAATNAVSGKTIQLTLLSTDSYKSISGSSIAIEGVVSPASIIKILKNGEVIAQTYRESESFMLTVPLDEGENIVTVSAILSDGTETSKEVRLYRKYATAIAKTDGEIHFSWWIIIVPFIILISVIWLSVVVRHHNKQKKVGWS